MATVFAIALPACGLDGQGLLADDGGASGSPDPVADSGAPSTTDGDDATITEPNDAGAVTGDDASISSPPPDAMPPPALDSGASLDGAPVAPPVTCASCTAQMCPTQLAACGAGSDCLKYRDCAYACIFSSGSSCTSSCATKYAGGKTAFGALTVCDIGCGGSCVAQLAVSSP